MNRIGVTLGGYHCETDLGLILTDADIQLPDVRISLVDVPGRDGLLDMSEAVDGTVRYKNRKITLKFATLERVSGQKWNELLSNVSDKIHGQKMKIEFDGDDYYYEGRCSVDKFSVDGNRQELTISCDCDPYKLEKEERVYSTHMGTSASVEVEVTGTNVSKQPWNVDLRWGSPEVPTFDWSSYVEIIIDFTTASNAMTRVDVQFVDTDKNVYNTQVTKTAKKNESKRITIATIGDEAPKSINWSKIYRILLSGATSATVTAVAVPTAILRVQGTRMPAVPQVDVDLPVTLTVKGNKYKLETGSWYDPNLVLDEGITAFIFEAEDNTDYAEVSVKFRGGRL